MPGLLPTTSGNARARASEQTRIASGDAEPTVLRSPVRVRRVRPPAGLAERGQAEPRAHPRRAPRHRRGAGRPQGRCISFGHEAFHLALEDEERRYFSSAVAPGRRRSTVGASPASQRPSRVVRSAGPSRCLRRVSYHGESKPARTELPATDGADQPTQTRGAASPVWSGPPIEKRST